MRHRGGSGRVHVVFFVNTLPSVDTGLVCSETRRSRGGSARPPAPRRSHARTLSLTWPVLSGLSSATTTRVTRRHVPFARDPSCADTRSCRVTPPQLRLRRLRNQRPYAHESGHEAHARKALAREAGLLTGTHDSSCAITSQVLHPDQGHRTCAAAALGEAKERTQRPGSQSPFAKVACPHLLTAPLRLSVALSHAFPLT